MLVAAEGLELLEATRELLSDRAPAKRVRAADLALLAGDLTPGDDMANLMDVRRQRERRDS